ncbi:ubiquitin-conjugating enzyme/RWD-like protein [Catenaria anguillulae PL171]|uniref:Ubiquitin-conjugating enzyme/RWD-like protein n=1 Tax=Catenaria anguillulae PL171 TaxID=765915 RepID=A0A1Y2H6E0_9FUNG|nr:ubiquitin-conjugating enzyme/RWD-like protein [Catenaria anguillulae PL171]
MSSKRIQKELKELTTNPPPGCTAMPKGNSMNEWIATIDGPEDSPYEGGTFYLSIKFPEGYPFSPPQISFTTKVYHCNISSSGGICLDTLKGSWSPALTIAKVLISIVSLLTDPNPDSPLSGDVARLYKSNRKAHDENARDWTRRYANVPPPANAVRHKPEVPKVDAKKAAPAPAPAAAAAPVPAASAAANKAAPAPAPETVVVVVDDDEASKAASSASGAPMSEPVVVVDSDDDDVVVVSETAAATTGAETRSSRKRKSATK